MSGKTVCLCIMAAALLTPYFAVLAEDGTVLQRPQTYEEHPSKEDSYKAAPDSDSFEGWPKGPLVSADSAILMDMDSGAVLYSKNADKPQFPASVTKFMSVLVALENSKPDDEVLFTDDSVSFLKYDDASIGMRPGEVISMKDALYAMLFASANEVSHAVAENVGKNSMGGDYGTFIKKMNLRAEEIGCTNSHWMNACGLHDDRHYTTAHDMAIIASVLYRRPMFRTIMGSTQYVIPPTCRVSDSRTVRQKHKMLIKGSRYYYEYAVGGKTGYTDNSGTTLVTMADNGVRRLAAVVLHDFGTEAYKDTLAMFDYGFCKDNFRLIPAPDNETSDMIRSFDDRDARVTAPFGAKFSELDKKIVLESRGSDRAKIYYAYKGSPVGSFDVTLTGKGFKELNGMEFKTPMSRAISGEAPEEAPEKAPEEGQDVRILFGIIALCATLITAGMGLIFHQIKAGARNHKNKGGENKISGFEARAAAAEREKNV